MDDKRLFVREIRTDETGRSIVIGVPDNGVAISVGDVFTKLSQITHTADDLRSGMSSFRPASYVEISLTVAAIEWPMRHDAQELPHGHTGALRLTGSGVDDVCSNCLLTT